jgi:nicotinic acid mononucleotide adenylyltransferase
LENQNSSIENNIEQIISQIHGSPYKISLFITGGGTEVIGELLKRGSGSSTLIEAYVPYSSKAFIDFFGKEPEKFASAKTAREMAMIAYQRALKICKEDETAENIIGIGVTCKLAKEGKEREEREHEIHFASQTFLKSTSTSLKIKDKRGREEEEKLASILILHEIAKLCDVLQSNEKLNAIIPKAGKISEVKSNVDVKTGDLLVKTLCNSEYSEKESVKIYSNNNERTDQPKLILSGSFNPCHKNHMLMAKIASAKYQMPVNFEISLANVDKPPIDFISLNSRLESLKISINHAQELVDSIYLTNAPLFADKASLFPDSRFIIGSDTLNRLFNVNYYRKGEDKFTLLNHFKKLNTRFVVYQRKDIEPIVDEDILQICDIIPFEDYEDDGTSSTKIRENKKENNY